MSTILCHRCSQRAVIRMRQHRLALCKDHFPAWIQNQVEKIITNYGMFTRNDRILLAVSGGKDSLALWDVLWQLGYPVDGLYINLGIDSGTSYSTKSEGFIEKFAQEHDLKFYSVNFQKQYGETVPETARRTRRGRSRPCSVCGLVKRHLMNQFACDHGYDVLVTAHNLDDQVAFLFGNLLEWDIERMRRQSPLLPTEQGFIRKAKPFYRLSERETTAYAIVRAIDYIQIECPFSTGSKQIQYKKLCGFFPPLSRDKA